MKTHINNLFLLPVLIAGLGLLLAGRVTAQTFTTLYSFTGGSDGAWPYAGLILSSNILYGTATQGGSGGGSGKGTVFAINTDGTGYTSLYSFGGGDDGANPYAGLVLSGNALYGTANRGGSSGYGTVFAVNIDGTGFTSLYSFTATQPSPTWAINSDGAAPESRLVLSGNTLYGTAPLGGSGGSGTVFAVNTDGTGFTVVYSFTGSSNIVNPNGSYNINSDGHEPTAGLISSSNTLYGTAFQGGSSGNGTVFKLNTDGTGFTTLHSFTASDPFTYVNSDGASPHGGLILSGNTLYGTAVSGGSFNSGTVFAVNTNGTGFTTLHSFTKTSGSLSTNSDGAYPGAGLILSGNTLYGTASRGGSSGSGTVFAVNTDGTGFTTLYSFTARSASSPYSNSDGGWPKSGLILSGNTLYGTAWIGGSSGSGTVFSLSLPPPRLALIHSGASVVLTWPTNAAGFTLQSTTNLGSLAFWTTNSPVPVVVNGQNTVTNPISGAQQFFRLSQ